MARLHGTVGEEAQRRADRGAGQNQQQAHRRRPAPDAAGSWPPPREQALRAAARGPDGQQRREGGGDEVGHRGAGVAGGEQTLEVDSRTSRRW